MHIVTTIAARYYCAQKCILQGYGTPLLSVEEKEDEKKEHNIYY
jgi:hypothetical protein